MQLTVNGQIRSAADASTLADLLTAMNFCPEQKGIAIAVKCRGHRPRDVGNHAPVQWRPRGYHSRGSGGVTTL